MIDKYNLTLRENVMLSQNKRIEQIYLSLLIEGYNVDESLVKAVYDKKRIENIEVSEINAILNFKEAYREIIQALLSDIDLDLLLRLNKVISRDDGFDWGVLRTSRISIDGNSFVFEVAKKAEIIEALDSILSIENATLRSLNLFCYLVKTNIFWSRNISLALLVANKIMIKNGCGIIIIKEEFISEFKGFYYAYLDSDLEKDSLIDFLYEKCLCGEKVTHI